MSKKSLIMLLLICSVLLPACSGSPIQREANTPQQTEAEQMPISTQEPSIVENTKIQQTVTEAGTKMKLLIGDTEVSVQWENNESVAALRDLAADEPLLIDMSMYGGFEQVGSIGTSLPRNDVQTVTEAGDIVLYSGNQIVIFYGSNSWAYTKLGRIEYLSSKELEGLLGSRNTTLTIFGGE